MLDQPSIGVQRVNYTVRNGTAVAGADFTATAGTLTFLPGEVTKTVRVFLTEDLLFEPSETLSLAFTAPTTPGLTPSGVPFVVLLAITDNEVPIRGTAINDSLVGRALPDQLFGLAGHDRLFGLAGNDTLVGGPGNDVLDGGPGNDVMIGGAGNDTFYFTQPGDRLVEAAGGGATRSSARATSRSLRTSRTSSSPEPPCWASAMPRTTASPATPSPTSSSAAPATTRSTAGEAPTS